MTASRFFARCAATCLLVASLPAQTLQSATIQKLLPADAKIIETADVGTVAQKPRLLVLWMRNPKEEVRNPNQGYCGDAVYGDNLVGPTRLSLVDSTNQKLLNTVEIVGPALRRDSADSFRLPFFVPNDYYTVPNVDSKREGVPRILDLRDFTGDGIAAEFVLFMYSACGIVSTSVFGYSAQSDRAIQYPVEIFDKKRKPEVKFWVEQVFAKTPIRPGYWDFTWEPGHGLEEVIHEQVSFDKVRQLFVDKRTMRTYPGTGLPK